MTSLQSLGRARDGEWDASSDHAEPSWSPQLVLLAVSASLAALQNRLALLDHVAPPACPGAKARGDLQVGRKSSLRSDLVLCEPS